LRRNPSKKGPDVETVDTCSGAAFATVSVPWLERIAMTITSRRRLE
jgi:hypothetical protein